MSCVPLVADEYELVVVVPATLLRVHAGLEVGGGAPSGPGPAGPRHVEPLLLQHVERLLDGRVLQEEPRRVSVRQPVVRISALVQRLAEHVTTEGHPSADQDSGDLPELDVR